MTKDYLKVLVVVGAVALTTSVEAQKGTIDLTFNTGTGPSGNVSCINVLPDGKILVGGGFTTWDGVEHKRIIRLNPDGSTDASFAGNVVGNGDVMAMAIQADGKIIIGGSFSQIAGGNKNRIARLNADGTVDNTFTVGQGFEVGFGVTVNVIKIQNDGKILVGGFFGKYDNVVKWNIVRLNSDGTIDPTWTTIGADNTVNDIEILADGKILVGGSFYKYDNYEDFPKGESLRYLVRANSDGSLDTTFIPADIDRWYDIVPMSNGKILLGGGNNPMHPVARLNADGSEDLTFGLINGSYFAALPDNYVAKVILQDNGEIVLGGIFENVIGFDTITASSISTPRSKIVGLTPNGFLDTDFDMGTGCESTQTNFRVDAMALQSDGKILIGGLDIEGYAGHSVNNIFRINGSGATTGISTLTNNEFTFYVYPNPANEDVTIDNVPSGSYLQIIDMTGKVVYNTITSDNKETISTTNFRGGLYIVQITNNKITTTRKLVINN